MKILLNTAGAAIVTFAAACAPKSIPPTTNLAATATTAPSDLEAVVRAAIDLGLGRPWGVAGTNYGISEPAAVIVANYPDMALDMLETDLNSPSPTRRANAYDYLERLFISKRRSFDRAAAMVMTHWPAEKDQWVRTLINLVVVDVEISGEEVSPQPSRRQSRVLRILRRSRN